MNGLSVNGLLMSRPESTLPTAGPDARTEVDLVYFFAPGVSETPQGVCVA